MNSLEINQKLRDQEALIQKLKRELTKVLERLTKHNPDNQTAEISPYFVAISEINPLARIDAASEVIKEMAAIIDYQTSNLIMSDLIKAVR